VHYKRPRCHNPVTSHREYSNRPGIRPSCISRLYNRSVIMLRSVHSLRYRYRPGSVKNTLNMTQSGWKNVFPGLSPFGTLYCTRLLAQPHPEQLPTFSHRLHIPQTLSSRMLLPSMVLAWHSGIPTTSKSA
jgi:hypothetical protein